MKKILLTTIAVAAFAQGASALEAGKMYARGDLGYQFYSLSITDNKSDRLKGFAGDIGFGYALSDSVRTDVTLNFARPTKSLDGSKLTTAQYTTLTKKLAIKDAKVAKDGSEVTGKVKAKEKSMGLMANVYYDFNNASEFTPYVMAGVGVSRNSLESKTIANLTTVVESKDVSATQDLSTTKSKNMTSFAYQVGVGAAYEMSKDIHLDVGYKMSGMTGKYKTAEVKDTAGTVTQIGGEKMASPKLSHTLTAGVRFAF